ncbi:MULTISPECIES: MBG domain-containing protein [Niastella]|uniref:SBBP repeat-containing protein n=1 Tax=Niastella soli TaxID=2821487 RepID=A0ABS3YTQ4_9BACT|nr:MBG domain-containing protein [Niastella soli]MBO9201301.1 SBBP repeat-containing protein [Niastella soli]
MKKLTWLAFLLMAGIVCNAQPFYNWAKRIGSSNADLGNSITVDASGNVYTTGNFVGTGDFDPGTGIQNLVSAGASDIFISKTDAAGQLVWAKRMGGASGDYGNSIAVDASGNVYITGYFSGTADLDPGPGMQNHTAVGFFDAFISKLDASGNFVWAKSFGGLLGEQAGSIAVDGSGNVYTTGIFNSTVDFDPGAGINYLTSAGGGDIFISKLDAMGNFVWAKSIGNAGSDNSESLEVDASGNVYTTGYFQGTVDFDPGPGTQPLTSVDDRDIYISKLDASGNFVWVKQIGGASYDVGYSIKVDASGNVYTAGFFQGTVDFDPGMNIHNLVSSGLTDVFILKLDAAGNFIWAKPLGGGGSDWAHSIVIDASDNVYLSGYFEGTVDFDTGTGTHTLTSAGGFDVFVIKLNYWGNFVWAGRMGGSGNDYGQSISVDVSGSNVYTTGYFQGTADFDPGANTENLVSAGDFDIFISKFSTTPNLTIIADAQSKVYGSADPQLSWQASGFANGDNASVITGSLARATGENTGTYAISQGSLAASGYTITYVGNDLTITPAALAITANAQTKVYGANDPALTYTAIGFANGDNNNIITGNLNRISGENAAVYTINQNTLNAGSNYTIVYTGNDLTITRAALAITANAQTKVYGANDPALTYTAIGFANGDNNNIITGSLDRISGENAGVYTINQNTLNAGSNYTIVYTGSDLTITRAALAITANAQTKVYGANDPALTYTAIGFANGDNNNILTGNLNRISGENVGVYTINQNTLNAGSNYTITYTINNLTITKVSQVITWVQDLTVGCNGMLAMQLTATANSGLPVNYRITNTGIATVSGAILTLLQPGATIVTAEQGGDANHLAATPVTRNLNYLLPSSVRQHFNDLLLFDNKTGEYAQWQWYKNGTPVAGATTAWYSETTPLNGTFYVLVTDKDGAQLQTCPITCTGSSTIAGGVRVYPNPVTRNATTTVTCDYSEAALQGARLLITDHTGVIWQQLTSVHPSNQVSLPPSNGVCIITLILSNGQKTTVNALVN